MSSRDDQIARIERRLNGLKRSMSEMREENAELRTQLATIHAYNAYMGDRIEDLEEKLEGYSEHFRRIHVNEDMIEDLDLRLQGKVGTSAFEVMDERTKQLRARIDFLTDYVDVERWEAQKAAQQRLETGKDA